MNEQESPTIEQIYPGYSQDELAEADETIKRYVHLVWRISKRLKSEDPENLTKALLNARFKRLRI